MDSIFDMYGNLVYSEATDMNGTLILPDSAMRTITLPDPNGFAGLKTTNFIKLELKPAATKSFHFFLFVFFFFHFLFLWIFEIVYE